MRKSWRNVGWGLVVLSVFVRSAHGQANSWTNSAGSKWESGVNWLLGVPPTNTQSGIFITNAVTKTVTNDATTAGSFPGTMTISNLQLSAPLGQTNTLSLANAGLAAPLRIINTLTISSGGALTITNSSVRVEGASTGALTIDGNVSLSDGSLVATNDYAQMGVSGNGSLTVMGGTTRFNSIAVATGTGRSGTITISGGTNLFTGNVNVGNNVSLTTTVTIWVTGGQFLATNAVGFGVSLGGGNGQMTVSNGTAIIDSLDSGVLSGSAGTFTAAGGASILSNLTIGTSAGANGAVWVTGGSVIANNVTLGFSGAGRLTVSNGTFATRTMITGLNAGAAGTLTVNGGQASVYSNFTVGNFACTSTGIVSVTGGELHVTNAASTAVLDVRSGTFTQSGGALDIDRLVVTNVCGRFIHAGGVLVYGTVLLDSNSSAVGDGIPNGWKQQYGFDPFDPTVSDADSDGDGFSNLQEYMAGTNPTNSASSFRITQVAREGNDVRITWTTVTNKGYRVLFATGGAAGNFTNNFGNLSPLITILIGGPAESVTNYLDVGGATNTPSRYYRVRLVP